MTSVNPDRPQSSIDGTNQGHSPVLKPIRDRILTGEYLTGTFLSLGSDAIAEIAAYSGFDFLIIDLEHGMGGLESLVRQLRAIAGSHTSALVRLAEISPSAIKRVLDLGAAGLVFPGVRTPEEVRLIVDAMRYPPRGTRGIHRTNRAAWFGKKWSHYLQHTHVATVIQIETVEALEAVDEIASIDGVDCLLLGPGDLTHALGIPEDYGNPKFWNAVSRVASAARKAGKSASIVSPTANLVAELKALGFNLIALSSDAGIVVAGLDRISDALRQ